MRKKPTARIKLSKVFMLSYSFFFLLKQNFYLNKNAEIDLCFMDYCICHCQ